MNEWIEISPPFPVGKTGSFVSSTRAENPIRITYFENPKEKDVIYTKVYCTDLSAGPPGHVHGGCQAAILDELMGSCAWHFQYPVVAANIEVNFLNMLPYHLPICGKAQIVEKKDRKIYVEASLYLNNEFYSKSRGLFLILDDEKVEQLKKLL